MPSPPTTNLILWLKADAGVYSDDPPSTPATANDTLIYSWVDQTSNAYTFHTVDAGDRPTLKTNVLNGKPGVYFQSSSGTKLYSTASISHNIGTNDFCLVCVYKTPATLGTWSAIFSVGTYTPGFYIPQTSAHPGISFTNDDTFNATLTASTAYISEFSRDTNHYFNLWHGQVGSAISHDAATFSDTASIANATLHIGSDNHYPDLFDGHIFEILLYTSALSSENKADLESYLNGRYSAVPTTATLSGPTSLSGPVGVASGNFTITLNSTADQSYSFPITYADSGGTITTSPVVISSGTTGTFTVTPSAPGANNVTLGAGTTGLTIEGSPVSYTGTSASSSSPSSLLDL